MGYKIKVNGADHTVDWEDHAGGRRGKVLEWRARTSAIVPAVTNAIFCGERQEFAKATDRHCTA